MYRKPTDFNPTTPNPEVDLSTEDEVILRKLRQESSGDTVFDPIEDTPTSNEMPAISPQQTSGAMRIIPPHTRYIILGEDLGIFGETHNAVCKHLCAHRWNIPRAIILPGPLYEKLEWHQLTPKPFNRTYLFIIAGMQRPFSIPVYRDIYVQLALPRNTILCLLS